MRLEEYERPLGIRGLHGAASFDKPVTRREYWADEAAAHGLSWFKLMDDGHGSQFAFAQMLRVRGIMPIIRLWDDSPLPDGLEPHYFDTVQRYVDEGVTRWFEILNEPNLPLEWQEGAWETHKGRRPRTMLEAWLPAAEEVIKRGGYPAFPCMAQSGHTPELGSIKWYEWSFSRMVKTFYDRAKWVFENGAWIASHDAVLNHCYQDAQGTWHFECPYDEIEQSDHPGTNIFDGDNSLIGHLVPVSLLKKHFGLFVPVISTEGGVFVPKGHPQPWAQEDDRYPGYNYQGHAERIVAMYRWLERYQATFPWYFGMCPWLMANRKMGHPQPAWKEDGWYHDLAGRLPVVEAVKAMGGPLENPQPFNYKRWPGWDLGDLGTTTMDEPIRVLFPDGEPREMELEEYLRGVLPKEMSEEAPLEALKAQAVAARCYAKAAIISPRHKEKDADICTTTHCQVWSPRHYSGTDAAVEATKGVVATYNDRVISAFYFGHCDGRTRKPTEAYPKPWLKDLPYTLPVDCICGYDEMYGHGVGMCQRGAMAMAEAGASFEEILWHYYSGVKVAGEPAPSPDVELEKLRAEIRVLEADKEVLEAKNEDLKEQIDLARSAIRAARNTLIGILDDLEKRGVR